MRLRWLRWGITATGLVVVGFGVLVALWPIEGTGVTGNAVRPQYTDFGWFAYEPLPEHPTLPDLRRAGVDLPQDLVGVRRRNAAVIAVVGVAVAAAGLLIRDRLDRL